MKFMDVSMISSTMARVNALTHWGRVMHKCIGEQNIIGSDNGLSPGRRQPITWTNAGILSTGPLGTNFSEILIKIYRFSFKKMLLKMPSGKWWPSCLSLNELIVTVCVLQIVSKQQCQVQCGAVIMRSIFSKTHALTIDGHSSPMKPSYGVSFVSP